MEENNSSKDGALSIEAFKINFIESVLSINSNKKDDLSESEKLLSIKLLSPHIAETLYKHEYEFSEAALSVFKDHLPDYLEAHEQMAQIIYSELLDGLNGDVNPSLNEVILKQAKNYNYPLIHQVCELIQGEESLFNFPRLFSAH